MIRDTNRDKGAKSWDKRAKKYINKKVLRHKIIDGGEKTCNYQN